jgi:hypothetical protein
MEKFICSKAIAVGDIEDDAKAWLIAHGATVEESDVTIIRLPDKAQVEGDGEWWRYIISFYGPDGNYEPHYCEVNINIDAYKTEISLITR